MISLIATLKNLLLIFLSKVGFSTIIVRWLHYLKTRYNLQKWRENIVCNAFFRNQAGVLSFGLAECMEVDTSAVQPVQSSGLPELATTQCCQLRPPPPSPFLPFKLGTTKTTTPSILKSQLSVMTLSTWGSGLLVEACQTTVDQVRDARPARGSWEVRTPAFTDHPQGQSYGCGHKPKYAFICCRMR